MKKLCGKEIQRKVLHLVFGIVIPVGIFYIPQYAHKITCLPSSVPAWLWSVILLAGFLVPFAVVEYLRLHVAPVSKFFNTLFGGMLREEESKKMTGATYICASSLICALVFRDRLHVAAMVISLFIWGDAVAALVGLSIGRIKIGKKSLEGSIACFICCIAMFVFLFPLAPGLLAA